MTQNVKPLSLVWLRRDLRLHDHAALAQALQKPGMVQPVFIFDTDILARFDNPQDRRLTFLAHALCDIDAKLRKRGGALLVLHGSAETLIPKLTKQLGAAHIFAAEDYEPGAMARDKAVAKVAPLTLVKDQVIFSPTEILKSDGTPFKVFTPYARAWRAALEPTSFAPYEINDKGRYAAPPEIVGQLHPERGAKAMLEEIGYRETYLPLWPVKDAHERLAAFAGAKMSHYPEARNFMAQEGTSRLSPYLRFGLVSVRECARIIFPSPLAGEGRVGGGAMESYPRNTPHPNPPPQGGREKWLSELIWREFYAMILYHWPQSAGQEWNPDFRGLAWSHHQEHFAAWKAGMTGYPLVDAAMRELSSTGWMHNRARMVVASFLTKHLQIDWRWGEEHFAQLLMDYDMASNVGGWQWAASTGTDAQPWFRIFNPELQSRKFDPKGAYIRRYVKELAGFEGDIHAPAGVADYPPPIVEHKQAREKALAMFKKATR